MAPSVEMITVEQKPEWEEVLACSYQHDFYHLPSYHALAESRGEGKAILLAYKEEPYLIALPLLLRPVRAISGLEDIGDGWNDATSVYGYAGPVASHIAIPEQVLENFRANLGNVLRDLRVVSLFSRLHPLIPQLELIRGLGEQITTGETISIDLTLPLEDQRARYRKNHKHGINRLKRAGVQCIRTTEDSHLSRFIGIYDETMHRVHAAETYFFGPHYFRALVSGCADSVHLFVAMINGEVIGGGLFTTCKGIIQYHLGGTLAAYLSIAPMKLIIDTVRMWANGNRLRVFHLGGGVGSQNDSLFQFKAGFSDRRHPFSVWRWVIFPEIYDRLIDHKKQWNNRQGLQRISPHYFPQYRCPTEPHERDEQ